LPTAMMYPGLALILAGFAGKGLTPKK